MRAGDAPVLVSVDVQTGPRHERSRRMRSGAGRSPARITLDGARANARRSNGGPGEASAMPGGVPIAASGAAEAMRTNARRVSCTNQRPVVDSLEHESHPD